MIVMLISTKFYHWKKKTDYKEEKKTNKYKRTILLNVLRVCSSVPIADNAQLCASMNSFNSYIEDNSSLITCMINNQI